MDSKSKMQMPSLTYTHSKDYGKAAKDQNQMLQCLGAPHVDSFNFMLEQGLKLAIKDLMPVEFQLPQGKRIKLVIKEHLFNTPKVPATAIGVRSQKVYPTECRQRGETYKAELMVTLAVYINDNLFTTVNRSMGEIPVMIMSDACHLSKMSPAELIKAKEHADEWGGYFIVKGHERLVRMLLILRKNYPVAIKRSTWKSRGSFFSEYGIQVRCVTEDHTAVNNVLHYLTNGTTKLMFSNKKLLYYAPLILVMKCLVDISDYHIYELLTQSKKDDSYYTGCVQNMLRELHTENLHSQKDCKLYLGKIFRVKFFELAPWLKDEEVTDFILDRCILIHLKDHIDKFNLLVFMTQKLYDFAQKKCVVEGADAVMMQELLLGGHLYLQILKDKLQSYLFIIKTQMMKKARNVPNFELTQKDLSTVLRASGSLENALEYFFSTGNISSSSGLGLMQDKGLTIIAENINRMRYMSHFRSVHRGAYFMGMRTTDARQLLPDAWGFVCPVHTPDGSPCGLLNHLTMQCIVTPAPQRELVESIPQVLASLGMRLITSVTVEDGNEFSYPVLLNGCFIGYLPNNNAESICNRLRQLKVEGKRIPYTTEIVLVPKKQVISQYPGLFLFTAESRMMRPVLNLALDKIELIGTFEQVYMNIAVTKSEIYKDRTTHIELSQTAFLSNLAQLIPMPDCNQSPRNMYQCQMGKQTMGTPVHTWNIQAETKLYRLQTPGSPIFRPVHHDKIALDDFPMGTNAIVAVISYTGYDMEDAMIINKSAYERGFAHGSIYKTEFIELKDPLSYFARDPNKTELSETLDEDGLPYIGTPLEPSKPLYGFYDAEHSKFNVVNYQGKELGYVDNVRLCGSFNLQQPKKIAISIRITRNPDVGDKFASRAGQKGICSQKWPAEDLPFTESGLIPDIVFNPHGFPSRMTIAMMIETMAGKSGTVHGLVHDATPFRFNEKDTAIDYFGRLLEAGGYNYYGTEKMYSGVDGREMTAEIFFGVVHYQRLRHMVSDKWQVRSTGPIDSLTRQPIKGRRRGGGVRFGEMERDSLISHGASFLLLDRLFHCSDKTKCLVCITCGTLIGPMTAIPKGGNVAPTSSYCRICKEKSNIAEMEIPYIFKFFVTQLAAVNINVQMKCSTGILF